MLSVGSIPIHFRFFVDRDRLSDNLLVSRATSK